MTWDHLQQLRAAAHSEIERCLGQRRPRAGSRVTVNGNTIAVDGDEPDPAPPPLTITIWQSVETTVVVVQDGKTETRTAEFPLEVVVRVLPGGRLEGSYAYENTQFGGFNSEDGSLSIQRTVKITYQQRPFLIPVTLRLQQVGFGNLIEYGGIETVDLPTGAPVIHRPHPNAQDTFLELHIRNVSRLGVS